MKFENIFDGKLLVLSNGETLAAIDRSFVCNKVAEYSAVLFRGFGADIAAFNDLVKRSSSRTSLDPARTFYGEAAQLVDAGVGPVGLHCENGNSPFWPDLAWFFCEKPATSGSQTTVCDGRRVWGRLNETTRELFLAQDIVYSRMVGAPRWKAFVANELGISADEASFDDLVRLAGGSKSRIERRGDDAIRYSFFTPAVRRGVLSSDLSFANSILGPSWNYERPTITFADGAAIPDDVMAEIEEVTEDETHQIDWRQGDVIVLDNTVLMHGRRAIIDPSRTIYNALSYL